VILGATKLQSSRAPITHTTPLGSSARDMWCSVWYGEGCPLSTGGAVQRKLFKLKIQVQNAGFLCIFIAKDWVCGPEKT